MGVCPLGVKVPNAGNKEESNCPCGCPTVQAAIMKLSLSKPLHKVNFLSKSLHKVTF